MHFNTEWSSTILIYVSEYNKNTFTHRLAWPWHCCPLGITWICRLIWIWPCSPDLLCFLSQAQLFWELFSCTLLLALATPIQHAHLSHFTWYALFQLKTLQMGAKGRFPVIAVRTWIYSLVQIFAGWFQDDEAYKVNKKVSACCP